MLFNPMLNANAPPAVGPLTARSLIRGSVVLVCLACAAWAVKGMVLGFETIDVVLVIAGVIGAVVAWIESTRPVPRPTTMVVIWLVLAMAVVPAESVWVGALHVTSILVLGSIGGLTVDDRHLGRFGLFVACCWVWVAAWTSARAGDSLTAARALGVQLVTVGIAAFVVVASRKHVVTTVTESRDLFHRVPVGLYRTSPDGTILAANVALAEMLGFQHPEELIGQSAARFYVTRGDRETMLAALSSHHGTTDTLLHLRRADGTPLWVRETLRIIRNADDEPTAFEGALADVTEQLTAEAQAEHARGLFAAAFEHAPVGMALVRRDGTIVRANNALFDLVAGGRADSWSELGGGTTAWTRLLEADEAGITVEQELATPAGSRWVRASASPVDTDEGHLLVCQLLDITPHKQLQLALEERVREKDQFVASVSHEIRTPLTAVLGFTGILTADTGTVSDDERGELLQLIHEQSTSVAHIVEDLLIAARSEIGELDVDPSPVALGDIAARTLRECASLQPGDVRVELSGGATAWADPLRVHQIMRNLLTNAYRYGGREVRVEISNAGSTASVAVIDDGEGIPPEERDAVFRPYHRAHRQVGVTGSIGLGLAVSRMLAQTMRGSLEYRRSDGRSVFELTLPVHESPAGGDGPSS